MKYAIVLLLTLLPLSGCASFRGDAGDETLAQTAPDVPGVDAVTQLKAADEMEAKTCPALNTLANICLITRDQARLLVK